MVSFKNKASIGLHKTLRPQRDYLSMCLWPVLSVLHSSPQLEPLYFCIRWLVHDSELCSLVNLVSLNGTLSMNPMDAQRYDLSKRCSVSFVIVSPLRSSTDQLYSPLVRRTASPMLPPLTVKSHQFIAMLL